MISLLAIYGWLGNVPLLTTYLTDEPTTKFSTAVTLLFAAISLFLSVWERDYSPRVRRWTRAISIGLAATVLVIGVDVFIEASLRLILHGGPLPSEWRDYEAQPLIIPPSPVTMMGIIFAGISLLVWRMRWGVSVLGFSTLGLATMGWFGLSERLYTLGNPRSLFFFGSPAIPTSLAFFLLATGLVFLRPREGFMRILTSPGPRGAFSRRFIPFALVFMMLYGWVQIQVETEWNFSRESAVASYSTIIVASLIAASMGTALIVEKIDLQRRHSQNRLRATERRFRLQIEGVRDYAIFTLDSAGKVSSWNEGAARIVGYEAGEIIGRHFSCFFPEAVAVDGEPARELEHAASVGSIERECWRRRKDGQLFWANVLLTAIRDDQGRLQGFSKVIRDITERREIEERLRDSEERFRSAFENSAIGMALVGLDGMWQRVNDALGRFIGYPPEVLRNTHFREVTHPEDLAGCLVAYGDLLAGRVNHWSAEKRYLHKSGATVWGRIAVSLIRGANGQPLYFVTEVQDITQQCRAEEQIKASLAEKEVLLREVHHRVKNNMQVITSLLQLQANHIPTEEGKAAFRECQLRIQTMAMIHERLYQSESLATINFGEHLTGLARLILRSHVHGDTEVALVTDCDAVELKLDLAIPLGLIATEMITNAFKHGFKGCERGCVEVTLKNPGDGKLYLAVADNGVGLPEGFSIHGSPSLGLRIMGNLSRQLRAELTCLNNNGTRMQVLLNV